MKALYYEGINKLSTGNVKDPEILNPRDVIVKVALSSVCGSDLHYLHGYIPAMKEGDILGHEFNVSSPQMPSLRALWQPIWP